MSKLTFRKITPEEFAAWKKRSQENYAAEKQKEGLTREDATAEAERSFQRHLPNGADTEHHHIYSVLFGDIVAGTLWWGLQTHGSQKVAWIFDIELSAEFRGKGLGRKTMELAIADVQKSGHHKLGLHVFGHNLVAQKLYSSMGFAATNIVMYKSL